MVCGGKKKGMWQSRHIPFFVLKTIKSQLFLLLHLLLHGALVVGGLVLGLLLLLPQTIGVLGDFDLGVTAGGEEEGNDEQGKETNHGGTR